MTKANGGIGVWFRDEIENAIRAVDQANLDVAQHIPTDQMMIYRAGWTAAIRSLSFMFGIDYGVTS